MLSIKNLRKYQSKGREFIYDNAKAALFMGMGLGKTITVLTAIRDLLFTGAAKKVLIIAPKRVALHTWPAEFKKWSHLKNLTYTVLHGRNRAERTMKLRSKADIHIINRENIPWLVLTLGTDYWPYDMVVIDESSSFKSHDSERFKALRSRYNAIKRCVLLTGTPAPNGLLDLWAQMYLLDQGKRLGPDISNYRARYFYPLPGYFGYAIRSKFCSDEIYRLIEDVCFTIKSDDFLELPPVIPNIIEVDLPPKARKQYDRLRLDWELTLGEEVVEVDYAAVLQNKLIQICNGAIYTDDEGSYVDIHDAKLEALDSILEEAAGSPVLLAYSYRSDMERIVKRYGKKVTVLDSNPETLDKWNRGEIPFLICHPASAGHGLNLQFGGHILVWFGLQWNLEYYQQFNARLARPGQEAEAVVMHQISSKGTVEGKVFRVLNNKKLTQEELIDFMKRPID